MENLKTRFPADLDYVTSLDTTVPVTEGIREIVITLLETTLLVAWWSSVLAELARDPDSTDRGAGLVDRNVRAVPDARLLDVTLAPPPHDAVVDHGPMARTDDESVFTEKPSIGNSANVSITRPAPRSVESGSRASSARTGRPPALPAGWSRAA